MHWLKKQKSQKLVASLILFLFLSVGVFGFAPETHALVTGHDAVAIAQFFASGDDSCDILCAPFKWLLYAVLVVFQVFASAALVLFEYVIKPGHIIGLMNLNAVVELWRFIRDFFNLFFILVLLFSAFATIFQVEQYSLKKLFLNILLGALLVNFSFPITRFLVDTTNVPMYYFANSISPTGTASGGTGSGFGTILSASELTDLIVPSGKKARETPFMALLQGVIFMFLFAISVMVLSVMMFVRVIGLVILLIFSPIGFIASAIPGLQKYGSEWWEKFWKYALFGPAAMLFLMVAVKFMAAVKASGIMSAPVKSLVTDVTAASDTSNLMAMVLFSLPIILIWMAIGSANSFSIAGAGAVTGMGEKFAKWGLKKPWQAAKFVDRKVESKMAGNRVMKYFSPRVWATAIKARSAEQEHSDQVPIDKAGAGVQDQLNEKISRFTYNYGFLKPKQWFKPGPDHTSHEFSVQQANVAKHSKETADVSTEGAYVIDELKAALHKGKADEIEAQMGLLAKENNLNDLLADALNRDEELRHLIDTKGLQVGVDGMIVMSTENTKEVFRRVLEKGGEKRGSEEEAKKMMVFASKAVAAGNIGMAGSANYDPKQGRFRVFDEAEQAGAAAGKFNNLEGQKRQIAMHPNALFTQTSGGWDDVNGMVGEAMIKTFNTVDTKHSDRSRSDTKKAVQDLYDRYIVRGEKRTDKDGNSVNSKFQELYETQSMFKSYVDAIISVQTGSKPTSSTSTP